jgi:hypothetical protein
MIYDREALDGRFLNAGRVADVLDELAEGVGALPIADYAWSVDTIAGAVRHLRRVTPVGLISLRESGTAEAPSLRAQIVTLQQCADIAIVRFDSAEDAFWELHVGDGNPRPVPEDQLEAAFDLVRAALEATAPNS